MVRPNSMPNGVAEMIKGADKGTLSLVALLEEAAEKSDEKQ